MRITKEYIYHIIDEQDLSGRKINKEKIWAYIRNKLRYNNKILTLERKKTIWNLFCGYLNKNFIYTNWR